MASPQHPIQGVEVMEYRPQGVEAVAWNHQLRGVVGGAYPQRENPCSQEAHPEDPQEVEEEEFGAMPLHQQVV